MKLTKTDIVECIVAFVGIVSLLAYIHVTAETRQSAGATHVLPMTIAAGWTIRADAGYSAVRFREVPVADVRV